MDPSEHITTQPALRPSADPNVDISLPLDVRSSRELGTRNLMVLAYGAAFALAVGPLMVVIAWQLDSLLPTDAQWGLLFWGSLALGVFLLAWIPYRVCESWPAHILVMLGAPPIYVWMQAIADRTRNQRFAGDDFASIWEGIAIGWTALWLLTGALGFVCVAMQPRYATPIMDKRRPA